MTNSRPNAVYPRAIEGAHSGSPKDVGGVYGDAEFLEGLNDPEHFDLDEFNTQRAKLKKRKSTTRNGINSIFRIVR